MKNFIGIFFFAIILLNATVNSQSKSDFFNNSNISLNFIGIDATQLKYYGDPGSQSPDDMKNILSNISFLMEKETEKYNITKAFQHSKIKYQFAPTLMANEAMNTANVIVSSSGDLKHLNNDIIKNIAGKYDFSKVEEGVALVFILESIEKQKNLLTAWPTLIDVKSKTVIISERMEAEGRGFGFRNFWASALNKMIKNIEKNSYRKWKLLK